MGTIEVQFRTRAGIRKLHCLPDETVATVIARLQAETGVPDISILSFRGRQLNPDRLLSSLAYQPGDAIVASTAEMTEEFDADANEEEATADESPSSDSSEPPDVDFMIAMFVDMGFTREQSEQKLRDANYDAELALSNLLAKEPVIAPDALLRPTDLGELQGKYEALSSGQRAQLLSLQETANTDLATALQIFLVCNGDREAALGCLKVQ
jgi:hypothetical protein